MPYRLNSKGARLLEQYSGAAKENLTRPIGGEKAISFNIMSDFTPLQKGALAYLAEHRDGWVESSEIARFYKLAPQAMRGPCHSLFLRGLLDKKED